MREFQKYQIAAIIIAIVCIIGFVLISMNTTPTSEEHEGEYLPEFHGYYYVSDIQEGHGNSSYSVIFHEVNFTFLYWYWPMRQVINNITVCASPQSLSVYVQVTFPDSSSEILMIVVDDPNSSLIGISSTLYGVSSAHASPQVGLATAETEELHSSWVYIVSSE